MEKRGAGFHVRIFFPTVDRLGFYHELLHLEYRSRSSSSRSVIRTYYLIRTSQNKEETTKRSLGGMKTRYIRNNRCCHGGAGQGLAGGVGGWGGRTGNGHNKSCWKSRNSLCGVCSWSVVPRIPHRHCCPCRYSSIHASKKCSCVLLLCIGGAAANQALEIKLSRQQASAYTRVDGCNVRQQYLACALVSLLARPSLRSMSLLLAVSRFLECVRVPLRVGI